MSACSRKPGQKNPSRNRRCITAANADAGLPLDYYWAATGLPLDYHGFVLTRDSNPSPSRPCTYMSTSAPTYLQAN